MPLRALRFKSCEFIQLVYCPPLSSGSNTSRWFVGSDPKLLQSPLRCNWWPSPSLHRECTRGGFCNFMHLKPISRELRRELYGRRRKGYEHFTKTFFAFTHFSKSNREITIAPPLFPQPPQVSLEREALPIQGQGSGRRRRGPSRRRWKRQRRWQGQGRRRGQRRRRPWPRETPLQRQRAFWTILNHKPWLLVFSLPVSLPSLSSSLFFFF